ncbi:MAG: hypothetical protein IAE89_14860 [Anaerolineae bacterium]|nr:hypothetical protein [Anaerolineae bacterium]
MAGSVNFPDILGELTQGARAQFGVVDAAASLRPRTPRVGKPFEIIVLLQNTLAAPVDVTVSLRLPEQDAKKQRGQFIAHSSRVMVGMKAAEVGYLSLSAMTLPTTIPGDLYKFAVEIQTRPQAKERRIRTSESGAITTELLPERSRDEFAALKSLAYTVKKPLGRSAIEAPLPLFGSGISPMNAAARAGWNSLWTLTGTPDPRPMMYVYGDDLLLETFPRGRRLHSYVPLLKATYEHFRAAGFDLYEPEAEIITKLMVLLLEYAAPVENGHGYANAGRYAVVPMLVNNPMELNPAPELPRWVLEMLRSIDAKAENARDPISLLTGALYPALAYDAARFAFALAERETGENLGSDVEQEHYASELARALGQDPQSVTLDFNRVYLPLVLGGLFVNEQMPIAREAPGELVSSILRILNQRSPTLSDEAQPLAEMTRSVINRMEHKYGFRSGA